MALAVLVCAYAAAFPARAIASPEPGGEPASDAIQPAADAQRYVDEVFASVTKTSDVVYGQAVNHDGQLLQLRLDLYQPTGDAETNRPAIVYIHGGSFESGDKSQGSDWLTRAAKRGYVGASISYRVWPGASTDLAKLAWAIPAAQHDAQAALRWLRAHATQLGINPTAIGAMGYSAGAVTSLHAAYRAHDPGQSGNDGYASDVAAAVSLAGASLEVTPHAPPVLMFHGNTDTTVMYGSAVATCQQAVQVGNECTLHTYPTGHLLSPFFDDIRPKIWTFLAETLVPALTPLPPVSTYHPVAPLRVLDTRQGADADVSDPPPGAAPASLGPGQGIDVPVLGVGDVPATGVAGVVLNVTAVAPTQATHVTAYPAGGPLPATSNLNVSAGETRAVLVTSGIGAGGAVRLRNHAGSLHLVADLVGWYGDDGLGSRFRPRAPVRALDTRDGTGGFLGALGPGATIALPVAGRLGVPADAEAVVLNVTGVQSSASTHVTVWPDGPAPVASNLNLAPGRTVPNLVIAKVGADGSVRIRNNSGTLHVVADLTGFFGTEGVQLVPVQPSRILDTRNGTGGPAAPIGPGQHRSLLVRATPGLPAHGVSAVVVSVTAVGATAPTHVTVWPSSEPRPLASNLNLAAGQTTANLVLVGLGGAGDLSLYNHAGQVHLVLDVVAYLR